MKQMNQVSAHWTQRVQSVNACMRKKLTHFEREQGPLLLQKRCSSCNECHVGRIEVPNQRKPSLALHRPR